MQPQLPPSGNPGGTSPAGEPFVESEVARFRQQVELAMKAAREALTGPRIAGSHIIIQHYTDMIGKSVDLFAPAIGQRQAWQIAGAAYCAAMEESTHSEEAHAPTEAQSPSGDQTSQDRLNDPERRARG